MSAKRKKEPYEQAWDNEWFSVARRRNRIKCCTCGHIHEWDFRLNEDGSIDARVRTVRRGSKK